MTARPPHEPIGRRKLLMGAGVGAAAIVAATVPAALPAQAAEAVTRTRPGSGPTGPLDENGKALAPPANLDPIASAPLSGYSYVFRGMWDFTPENFISGRTWTSAGGTYAPVGSGDTLWTLVEVPPGAVLGDVEWYLSADATTELMGRVWVAGTPTLMKVVADGTIAATSTHGLVRAQRVVPTSGTNGPYPHGTMLAFGVFTPSDASVAVNGIRVGFKQGAARTGLLPAPVRVYDSRTAGGKFAAGSARTISLASVIPAGASGALVNITALSGEGTGYLKVYPSSASAPAASAINFSGSGAAIANSMTVAVSSARAIRIYASDKVHVIVDVTGNVG
jgi:hypothetical protein